MIYDGLRVVDRSQSLAGAYAAKLLTDCGADTVCIEDRVAVDALDAVARAHRDYLRTSQHSVDASRAEELTARADIVIASEPVVVERFLDDRVVVERFLDDRVVVERFLDDRVAVDGPLVTVAITPFGHGGPDDALNALAFGDEVLQARSGALMGHGHMTMPPLTVAGRLGEYVAGTFGALGAATAWRRAARLGEREHVDVSVLEAMQLTMLTYPTLYGDFPGGGRRSFRFVMIPGNEACADGNYVGITTNTVAQWKALLSAAGRDDLAADPELDTMLGRFMRGAEVQGALHAWTIEHSAADIEAACIAHRVPVAVVGNGRTLLEFDHLREREVYVAQPGASWLRPRAPFRFHAVAPRPMAPAPEPASAPPDWAATRDRMVERPPGDVDRDRPLSGVRVLDFTAFWAGPFATAWLAALGADVIKVEAVQRPDGMRLAGSTLLGKPGALEASPVFHAANLDKRAITLDCTRPEGVALARRLAATCDVVCENFTPRVMEEWHLDYDALRALRPDVIMLRLPAFGLTGPWRDRPGFAQTMEALCGMAWTTGYDDGPPIIAGGVVDPMVGGHVTLAVLAALEHRAATGEGQLVEMPMVDVAVAATADQVIRYQLTGDVGGRRGAGGVYRCAGDDDWVTVAREHDPLDEAARAQWCATRTNLDAQRELVAQGIPALAAVPGFATLDDPQLRARGFFEPLTHAVVGEQQFPTWPVRFSAGPARFTRRAAPMLGEHNEEVLGGELGLSPDELARLRADGIIGESPALGG